MTCISAAYAVPWCLSVYLSVRPSVRLSRSCILSKSSIFSPSGSHTIDQQLTVVRAVVYNSYGARLFTAQTATHQ